MKEKLKVFKYRNFGEKKGRKTKAAPASASIVGREKFLECAPPPPSRFLEKNNLHAKRVSAQIFKQFINRDDKRSKHYTRLSFSFLRK